MYCALTFPCYGLLRGVRLMLGYYAVGAVAVSLGFVAGTALSFSKVSGLYERVAQQEGVIADFADVMRKIAAVLAERRDSSGRELIDLANDTLARHDR